MTGGAAGGGWRPWRAVKRWFSGELDDMTVRCAALGRALIERARTTGRAARGDALAHAAAAARGAPRCGVAPAARSGAARRAPDTAKIKSKMVYTSSKGDLRKKLVGIGTEIQATDHSEIDFNTVLDKVTRGGTTA